jgi:DNA-binding LacI/PurR family transcriptional regulator
VRVPGQVSLIGMDSTPIADFRARPITSLDASLYKMGRLAVEMLSERIAGRDAGVPANQSLPMQLKDRGSTAAVSR